MPKIKYQDKRFNQDKLQAISRANRICEDYERQGYDLTLRQLCAVVRGGGSGGRR